ncbi:hypothetical protein IAQ61_008274 [Plenodomus lingam]|uniref:uncharacterized protein n=1 Tax=Leptosphaeria maculans TaxID=5022 RepID=UPI003332BCD7|nr:hypothetical protein IAQ61_008274 [Plenodomus lingam]
MQLASDSVVFPSHLWSSITCHCHSSSNTVETPNTMVMFRVSPMLVCAITPGEYSFIMATVVSDLNASEFSLRYQNFILFQENSSFGEHDLGRKWKVAGDKTSSKADEMYIASVW